MDDLDVSAERCQCAATKRRLVIPCLYEQLQNIICVFKWLKARNSSYNYTIPEIKLLMSGIVKLKQGLMKEIGTTESIESTIECICAVPLSDLNINIKDLCQRAFVITESLMEDEAFSNSNVCPMLSEVLWGLKTIEEVLPKKQDTITY